MVSTCSPFTWNALPQRARTGLCDSHSHSGRTPNTCTTCCGTQSVQRSTDNGPARCLMQCAHFREKREPQRSGAMIHTTCRETRPENPCSTLTSSSLLATWSDHMQQISTADQIPVLAPLACHILIYVASIHVQIWSATRLSTAAFAAAFCFSVSSFQIRHCWPN